MARMRTRLWLLAALVVAGTCLSTAQQPTAPAPQTAALTERIPADPAITIGTLPNGITYYIRPNKKPENRAALRLAVNAGSILEDEDQRGLAHMVEHMAFNGTKNFPGMGIVNFLQSIGMQFGAHVNAYTSFDETVYQLQVPTDKADVLDKAFLVLEDWAHNVTFDTREVDKERGVVMEEWRLGRGAGMRVLDKQFPVLLKDSRYSERLPIGKPEVLQGAKPERLTTFYKDWYRPDLMAVVAVGDFDKAAIQKLIENHFAGIPPARGAKPRTSYKVPDQPGTRYTVASDKELPGADVDVYSLVDARPQGTVGDYRRSIVEGLFASMLNQRFGEMTQKPDAPFLRASAGAGSLVRTKDTRSLNVVTREDGIEKGLDAALTEAERVARFGFTATELERARANVLRGLERAAAEKDNQQSASLADEFIRNFLQQEPIPGIVYENELYKRFLPQITLAEINALAKDWTPNRSRIVAASGPEKPGLTLPDEKQLAAVMATAADKPITAYVDSAASAPLLDAMPTPGTIAKDTTKAAFGITEWELSNGVRVVLKPTNFKEDEILFSAVSPGGTSLASDADYVPASTASTVVARGGLGKLSAIDLQKAMAGKAASASASIGETEERLSGSGSKKDLETMFQLIYLRFTQPRPDPTAFEAMTSQTKAMLANQTATPGFAFNEMITNTLYQNHPRRQPMTPVRVDQMNLDKSLAFYKERFADASDFTFTFVGSFDLATMKPLVEKYLGGLPSLKRNETWKDVGVRSPSGVVRKMVEKGIEPKSETVMIFTGPFAYTQENRIAMRAMADVLQNRLREKLREDLGGTYSVSVGPSYTKVPREEYELSIQFGSAPSRVEELRKAVLAEIEELKTNGPTATQVSDVRETMLRNYETQSKTNQFFLNEISIRNYYGEDLAILFNLAAYYNTLTPAIVQQAAKTYLNTNNYVDVELYPEKK